MTQSSSSWVNCGKSCLLWATSWTPCAVIQKELQVKTGHAHIFASQTCTHGSSMQICSLIQVQICCSWNSEVISGVISHSVQPSSRMRVQRKVLNVFFTEFQTKKHIHIIQCLEIAYLAVSLVNSIKIMSTSEQCSSFSLVTSSKFIIFVYTFCYSIYIDQALMSCQ